MKEYDVQITETLQRTVTIKANSQVEAEQLVETAWNREEYVLGADDFVGADFAVKSAHSLDRPKKNNELER